MKKNNNSIFFLVLLLGALLVIASYSLVYSKYKKEAANIEAQNETLQARVNTLKVYYDNRETYKKEMAQNLADVDEILKKYPSDVKIEDVVMEAVAMENGRSIEFSDLTISANNTIFQVPEEVVAAMEDEKYPKPISFKMRQVAYNNNVKYPVLKSVIAQIQDLPDQVSIGLINYFKNETEEEGQFLSGSINLLFYNVAGTTKPYVAPELFEYEAGTDNIFGVYVSPEEEEQQQQQQDVVNE